MRICEDCKKDMGAGENRKTCTKCGKACCARCLTKHDTEFAKAKPRNRMSLVNLIEKNWDGYSPPMLEDAKVDIDRLVAVIRRIEGENKEKTKGLAKLEKEFAELNEKFSYAAAEVKRLRSEMPRAKLGTARSAMYEMLVIIKASLERTKDEELK